MVLHKLAPRKVVPRFIGHAIWLTTLFCMVSTGLPVSAQTTRTPESSPPPATTPLEERIAWLATNPSHTALYDVFLGVLTDIPTVSEALALGNSVVQTFVIPSVRHAALTRLAGIARTARRFDETVELYEAAFLASGGRDLHSLYNQAQASLEVGDFASADELARTVVGRTDDYELKRRATTLAVRVLDQRGDYDTAMKILDTLTSLDNPEFVEPETLVLRLRLAQQSGDEALASKAAYQLAKLFPHSVANLAEGGRNIVPSPLPSALLVSQHWRNAADQTDDSAVESASERERLRPAITAVQVGSFSDPDNAEHLAERLRALDFDARAESIRRDGLSHQQVVIAVPEGTKAAASRVIAALRENGYDGFLVY